MVKIITDTLACLPQEVAERYQIPVIPQIIIFGEESFREGIDMDHQAFMQRLKTSTELPKTSAPAPEWFAAEFKRLVPLDETILCIHPSAEVSGTVRSAIVAAQDFPGADIRVIDTRVLASPQGTMVTLAAKWAAAGVDANTIEARLKDLSQRARIYFIVDTLEYLARGGRIGGAAALVGSLLQIKPILTLCDGRVDQYQRERTHKRAITHIKQLVVNQFPGEGEVYGYLSVLHAGVPGEAKVLATEFEEQFNLKEVPIFNVPPAVITHGGPGILGVAFFVI